MNYTKCYNCGENKPPSEERQNWFLYCSKECKEEKDAKSLELRLKAAETHNPWDRMTEAEREVQRRLLNTTGPVVWSQEVFDAVKIEAGGGPPKKRADGKVDGRAKGMRKCGKCGESGHNARTCGQHRSSYKNSLPSALLPKKRSASDTEATQVTSDDNAEQSSDQKSKFSREAVRASKKLSKKPRRRKKGKRKCGSCGKSGHNARTCKS